MAAEEHADLEARKPLHWVVARLRRARIDSGLSRDEIGQQVGRSPFTIRAWETGRAEPGLAQVEAWAATHSLYLTLSPERPAQTPLTNKAADVVLIVRTRRMLATGEARRIREAAELTLVEAGAAVNVDYKTIHKWETGKTRPQPATALLYGRFLLALKDALTLELATEELGEAS